MQRAAAQGREMNKTAETLAGGGVIGEEDRARAQVYALIGVLLAAPPEEKLLHALRQLQVPASEPDGAMTAAWVLIKQAAERAEPSKLREEYQDLFIGIGRGELVPYGSWYVTGFLMEKPLVELRLDLKRLGFQVQEGVREPEDHVAALCETMSLIIASPEISFDAQRQFFKKHVDPWMGRFFGDLAGAQSANFFRAVGLLGERFFEVERTYLSMLV
jgi:TorA maturation chaperone TorD